MWEFELQQQAETTAIATLIENRDTPLFNIQTQLDQTWPADTANQAAKQVQETDGGTKLSNSAIRQ